jgi:flavorubredoxin
LSFKPKPLLVVYDPSGGHCARILPRMQQMLHDRGFLVTLATTEDAPTDLEDYAGVIVGTPSSLRGAGPTAAVEAWLARAEALDEKKVAVFSTFWALPGRALDHLRARLTELGAEVVVEHAYWLARPAEGEHVLPAECMVRIR